jgi:predicted Zn finger-like uncharacterized protein
MRFICTHCDKELNIPDDRLPPSQKFKVKCPHCSEALLLDKKNPMTERAEQKAPPRSEAAKPEQQDVPSLTEMDPEIFPPGARIVFMLLHSTEWSEAASNFFQEMGYHESSAKDRSEALLKLRMNDYHVIMLEETGDTNALIEEIGRWPGQRRRNYNLILLGNAAQSLDPHFAFRKGVNCYLNVNDSDRGHDLLGFALRGFEEFYRFLSQAQSREKS